MTDEMLLDFGQDLVWSLFVRILLTGGDLTGLPVDRIVSYEEQDTAPLQTLDARV